MGYQVARFTNKIDEEFHCLICYMVLENPMMSPCEHTYCDKCIKEWLAVEESCPVECGPLKLVDLKPATRTVRNLLNKFEIKCNFEPEGCAEIVKLENLQDHVDICTYNSNADIICDKGCNSKMTRQEYQTYNCFKHLKDQVTRQQEQITEFRRQLERFENIVSRQAGEISKLNDELVKVNDDNIKFYDELRSLRSQFDQFKSEISLQQEKIQSNMVNKNDPSEQTDASIKIKILRSVNCVGIGFTPKSQTDSPFFPNGSVAYFSIGTIWVDTKSERLGEKWRKGDIVECGMKYPCDFVNGGSKSANAYFIQNRLLLGEKVVKVPNDGFVTKVIVGNGDKIEYLDD